MEAAIRLSPRRRRLTTIAACARLRGLSPKTAEAAVRGLPRTFFAVVVRRNEEIVGMGRVIGDGGLFLQIVDIAVEPTHQGRGFGQRDHGRFGRSSQAPTPGAYASLIADGEAHRLYSGFGFKPNAPTSIGMAMVVDRA